MAADAPAAPNQMASDAASTGLVGRMPRRRSSIKRPMTPEQQAINIGLAGIGGVIAQFATHPFETTMVRQQLAGSLAEGGNMLSMSRRIVDAEGITALWRGYSAAAIREIFYSSLRFGLYEPIKTVLQADPRHYGGDATKVPFWKKMLAGCAAGSIGSAIASPTDLLKTRMQRETTLPPRSIGCHLREICKEPPGLPFNLYLGAGATITRAAILGGTKMAVYDTCKVFMKYTVGLSERRSWAEKVLGVQLGASVFTGLAVTATTSPFTNARTHIMSLPRGTHTSMAACMLDIVRTKGPLGACRRRPTRPGARARAVGRAAHRAAPLPSCPGAPLGRTRAVRRLRRAVGPLRPVRDHPVHRVGEAARALRHPAHLIARV